MKLYYGNELLVEVTTNHSMSIDEMLEYMDETMEEYAERNGWDGWDYEELRIEA